MIELAIVIVIVAALGILATLLRQPLVLAYLATGAIIGYFGFFHVTDREFFRVFSDLGIMFLLFLIGLEINYTSLRLVGKTSLIIGMGQILFTSLIGFGISTLLGFGMLPSLYIAIALTFSSTIIVIKILSDKKDLNSLYGKISIGFLLVQDFVAILILISLAGIQADGSFLLKPLLITLAEGIGLFLLMLWLGRKIMPKVFDIIAHSQELLFIASLAWVFLIAATVSRIGFSIEIGGFLAGLALANSSEHFQIANRIKSLRDFFILIFFVILGSSLALTHFDGLALPIILLSAFVLIGNPLIVMVLMGLMGYRARTSFFAGVTVAQISEFSLILAALGLKTGHIAEETVAIITAVGIVTITLSSYLMIHSERIFKLLERHLRIFERAHPAQEALPGIAQKRIILFGFHRTGKSVATELPKDEFLVIDFDPEVIQRLRKKNIACVFGDMRDSLVLDEAGVRQASVVISTNPDLEDNLVLLQHLRRTKKRPSIIVRARTDFDADALYRAGAHYVILPHFTTGKYIGKAVKQGITKTSLAALKKKDIALFERRNELLA
ncbi:MAG: sodium:proton exchanger [Candidatus Niyogibacteria bacterium CG10_big_fil_rev_8_21_14_0_10_46_36]|uniref:Sodium:proton exchanger n=1 Tax=Candidatus Niyogibacteria bacterium CG10_big_fil_rev_8_21_14_0_10_46_36 TaxID=1974726 RepID=A0A2H0TDG7_9BACT|nr:MAG: sodium:proton exchanger [Candidatus Niyogibacteria bacterium CG10_big_fil_rev_8_21_14_0_10_46_36]